MKKVAKKSTVKTKSAPAKKKVAAANTKKAKIVKLSKEKSKELKPNNALLKDEIKSTKEWIKQMTEQHLMAVEATTGKVLRKDREYCKDLGNRILAKRYSITKL